MSKKVAKRVILNQILKNNDLTKLELYIWLNVLCAENGGLEPKLLPKLVVKIVILEKNIKVWNVG